MFGNLYMLCMCLTTSSPAVAAGESVPSKDEIKNPSRQFAMMFADAPNSPCLERSQETKARGISSPWEESIGNEK